MRPGIPVILFMGILAATAAEQIPRGLEFLEERVRKDPDDFVARTQLTERYLAQLRETGSMKWLPLAEAAAIESLRDIPPQSNPAGVLARGRVALAAHRFAAARKDATLFLQLCPEKVAGLYLLFDAQFELGDYAAAGATMKEMENLESENIAIHARRARLAWALGQDAAPHLAASVDSARNLSPAQPGLLAWALVQSGEHSFRTGNFEAAEKAYAEALHHRPGDWNATGHLAELRAAGGRFDDALALLAAAVQATDNRPELMHAAGDVALAAGREAEARAWHDRALAGYRASVDRGESLHLHNLSAFHCESRPDYAEAVKLARKDFGERKSIGTCDALAWALSLAGEHAEAAKFADLALASGTRDSHVLYHAGMIAMSDGKIEKGRDLIRRAAAENPHHQSIHFHR